MKKKPLTLLMLAALGAPMVTEAADPPYTISGNLSLVSDYAFRGISQTVAAPAIQGGFDFNHSSGFYLGTWASNVSELLYNGNMEWDFYGGYNWTVNKDFSINVGGLYYHYPNGGATGFDPNTFEVYAGATWKWFNVKASYATTDLFGLPNSEGSIYYEANFNYTLPMAINFAAHYGWTEVENYSGFDYEDWKVGVSKEFGGFNFGLAYVDTNLPSFKIKGDDITEGRVVVSIGKTF